MPGPNWQIGDHVFVRGAEWRIREAIAWPDCSLLRLTTVNGTTRTRSLLLPFDKPQRLNRSRGVRFTRLRRWLHELRRVAMTLAPYGGAIAAGGASARLLPHQLEPLLAILRHGATRLLIADAVGLGKTIQAGLILLELSARSEEFRALVLVPAGLREQWRQELRERFDLNSTQADANWLRASAAERPGDVNPWSLPGIYIASVDFAKRAEVLRALEDVMWDVMVLDEAHLASVASDRRAAAHAVASRSRRTVLLTATPDTGDPIAFAALCALGRLDRSEPAVTFFRRTRAEVHDGAGRRSVLLRVRPTPAERRMHELLERYTSQVWQESSARGDARAKLATIVLRKRALSSASSLAISAQRRLTLLATGPAPIERQLLLPLADEDPLTDGVADDDLAAPGLADVRRERRWLGAIAEAARHASRSESKVRRLLRWLARVHEPVIVFTEYRDTLHRLERLIRAAGRQVITLHGGLDRAERYRAQAVFNTGDVMLLATDAAAEGLNLHHRCRIVLHYELPWRPARIEQRAGRVDRLGQSQRVHEIALVAADTAERLVLAPLVIRAANARANGGISAGLLDSLREAAVSELVIAGTPLPPMPVGQTPAAIRSMDLRAEAAAEVERLETLRNWRSRSSAPRSCRGRRPAITVARMRSRNRPLEPGLILVFVLSLTEPDRKAVHSEISIVSVSGTSNGELEPGALRHLVQQLDVLCHQPGNALHGRLADQLVSMTDRLEPIRTGARRLLRNREARLRCALPSAAREMVQAGLFDRRSISVSSRRRAVRDGQTYELDARIRSLDDATPLVRSVDLAAVLLIR
jgi:superfamily II DNA or RNA helicase